MNIFLLKPEDQIIETKNIQGLIQMTRNICKIGNMLEKRKPESKHSFFLLTMSSIKYYETCDIGVSFSSHFSQKLSGATAWF